MPEIPLNLSDLTNRQVASIFLENTALCLDELPADPATIPTRELHQSWVGDILIALLGVGHAVLDVADATREQTRRTEKIYEDWLDD